MVSKIQGCIESQLGRIDEFDRTQCQKSFIFVFSQRLVPNAQSLAFICLYDNITLSLTFPFHPCFNEKIEF